MLGALFPAHFPPAHIIYVWGKSETLTSIARRDSAKSPHYLSLTISHECDKTSMPSLKYKFSAPPFKKKNKKNNKKTGQVILLVEKIFMKV